MMSRPARRPRLRLASLLVPVVAGVLLAATLGAPAAHAVGANPVPVTVPSLRSWQGGQGCWELTPRTRIVIAPSAVAELRTAARLLAGELAAQEGVRPRIVSGTPSTHDIGLVVGDVPGAAGSEAYRLTLEDTARLTGASREGVIHGTRTLLQALRTSPRAHSVARGTATDWPLFGDRGQMLDVGRKYFPVDYLKQQIRQSAWYKLNTFHLHLSDWNGYRIESAKYPEIVAEQHYTKRELRDLEDYAERYGVTVVPEIDLPGHSVAIGNAKPGLAFSCESMARPGTSWEGSDLGHWTLDYTKPATRAFARDLVAEVADIFRKSPYIHIGTDEVPLEAAQKACPELVAYQKAKGYPYVGDALVEFINDLDRTVRDHGKTTQVWQWWDYQQPTSITPDRRIVVNEWLSSPEGRAAKGYRTIGIQDGPLYVSPGFGATPGSYGFFDIRTTYRDYAFTQRDGILGYRVARWSDHTQTFPLSWVDYFARRPLAVVAERTWATPAGSDVRPFLDRYDQVGDALPLPVTGDIGENPGMLSQDGWTATATSQETTGEAGQASRAVDNDPYTHWHSDYGAGLPQQLSIDLGREQHLSGIRYMPRQDGGTNGRVKAYEVLVSDDGATWRKVATGTFPNDRTEYVVPVAPVTARQVALRALSEHGDQNRFAAVAELDVVRAR
ncbi:family 20 glycosylhydrolase [Streptomyces sp. NPDC056696]|uniref:family 20 glycosylhydrolase n=1 Tax=unclassified Streptomyces TaxID=2593676 RepID=UPI0036D101BC